MPELMPHYDRVCALVGDDNRALQILSHYRPAPDIVGCSQAVWLGDGGPALACAVIVKRVDERTRSKTSINELLRD